MAEFESKSAAPGEGGASENIGQRGPDSATHNFTVNGDANKPPQALVDADRWIKWKSVQDADGKPRKRPRGKWKGQENWLSHDQVNGKKGFVLGDGFGGIDLDGCRNPETGEMTHWAKGWVDQFASYAEVSPSGTGVKIFVAGAPNALPCSTIHMGGEPINGKNPQVEAYVDDGRWFAVTGWHLEGTPHEIVDGGKAWDRLVAALSKDDDTGGDKKSFAGRNEALHRLACKQRERGMGDDKIAEYVYRLNHEADAEVHPNFADGPVPDSEADDVIKQVCRYPVGSPELAEMNAKHAFIHHWGAKPKVLSWRDDHEMGRKTAVAQSPADIKMRYDTRRIPTGQDKSVGLGTYWLGHPARMEYDTIGFAPGEQHDGMFNLWRGFGVTPRAGDWSRLKAHLWERIAQQDQTNYDYIIKWIAWCLQNPGERAEVALVLRGGRGAGKGMVADAIMRAFGQHAIHLSNPNQVSGGFNAQHEDCAFMFADEAVAPSSRKAAEDLKRMITERSLNIERKGIDAYPVRNRLKIMMASNNDWVVPAGPDERRFAVFSVASRTASDRAYFKALAKEIEGDGPAAMLYELRAMDLGDWHPRDDIPQTDDLNQQKNHALSPAEIGIRDLLADTVLYDENGSFVEGGRLFASSTDLIEFVRKRTGVTVNGNDLQPLLGRRLGLYKKKRHNINGYWFPSLPEARNLWDQVVTPADWDDSEGWSVNSKHGF